MLDMSSIEEFQNEDLSGLKTYQVSEYSVLDLTAPIYSFDIMDLINQTTELSNSQRLGDYSPCKDPRLNILIRTVAQSRAIYLNKMYSTDTYHIANEIKAMILSPQDLKKHLNNISVFDEMITILERLTR